jgi:hypothetical protein
MNDAYLFMAHGYCKRKAFQTILKGLHKLLAEWFLNYNQTSLEAYWTLSKGLYSSLMDLTLVNLWR